MQQHEIHLVIGPMFSGKSSYLICQGDHRSHSIKGCKLLYVNHVSDTRYGENAVISHMGMSVDAIAVSTLEQLESMDKFIEADIVCIDELQFFKGVKSFLLKHKKIYYVGALNGDSDMNLFGETHELIPICDTIKYKKARCYNCGGDAMFSKCIVSKNSQTLIGTSNSYKASCRYCRDKK